MFLKKINFKKKYPIIVTFVEAYLLPIGKISAAFADFGKFLKNISVVLHEIKLI